MSQAELNINKIQIIYLNLFLTQFEFGFIVKVDYMFKPNSFSYWTSSNLFTSYLINLIFSPNILNIAAFFFYSFTNLC